MWLDTSNKSIAVSAIGTTSMTAKKKTCLIEAGKENGTGGNSVLFGFAQFVVWGNPSEEISCSPAACELRGFFYF